MPTFQRAWLLIAGIFLLNFVGVLFDWYGQDRWVDIPMHFAGGFAVAYFALAGWNALIQKVSLQKNVKSAWHVIVYGLGILGCVALVGVIWEWYEVVLDWIVVNYSYGDRLSQMSLGDTMLDLFLDLLGGLTAFILFRRRE